MLQIGPHRFPNRWILAPMAGVSEMPFRTIAREMGAGAAPTELVSAKGLLFGQSRTARYLTRHVSETPFWVQLFGGEPDVMADGAKRAQDLGADIIDINMGCPVNKVTKKGAGSALLCDPDRAASIVAAICKSTSLPVTVKIRAGWDDASLNAPVMAKRLEDAGCAAVSLHARTREQGYSGNANWHLIKELVDAVKIPVIGNGDVRSVTDAHRMLTETGCHGIMVGRAALGNPWIFRSLQAGKDLEPMCSERWTTVFDHFNRHLEFIGDRLTAIRRFRSHLAWYATGLAGAAEFRRRVMVIDELDELMPACRDYFQNAERVERRKEVEYDTRTALG